MKVWGPLIAGLVLLLLGILWTLQGLGVTGQSGGMNGQTIWAVIGPIVGVVGIVLIGLSIGIRIKRGA
jgi:hypothetical protein